MPLLQPSLPTNRDFVGQLRAPPPGTSAAYGTQVKQLISGQVVAAIPVAYRRHPQNGAVWCGRAVSHARNITGVSNPVPRRR